MTLRLMHVVRRVLNRLEVDGGRSQGDKTGPTLARLVTNDVCWEHMMDWVTIELLAETVRMAFVATLGRRIVAPNSVSVLSMRRRERGST